MRYPVRALILLLTLLITACPRLPGLLTRTGPQEPTGAQAGQAAPIQGTVDFSVPGRTTQAAIGEIAKGATVALIEVGTGFTVATTVTDDNGRFNMTFATGWKPPVGVVYYLEAIKGLSASKPLPNRVGADLARVRTLVVFQDVWLSISGVGIAVNPTTTALSIIHSLREMTPAGANRRITAKDLIGVMDSSPGTATMPSPVTFANTGLLPAQTVTDTYLVVLDALAKDYDPFRAAVLDTTDPLYNKVLNVPRVVSLASLYPNVQTIGGTIELIGSGFAATASENVVEFSDVAGGPVPAVVATVSADLARLTVAVPDGAVTGPVAVTVGSRKMIGPIFYLALQSGHEALDTDGNLYVANESFGTIARITAQGQISTWATGLTNPRALTIRNSTMYVTCAGTATGIVSLDLNNPAAAPVSIGVAGVVNADPRGIAFDATGRLYVSRGDNNTIHRFDLAAGTTASVVTSGQFPSSPRGVAFGPDGRLYVASFADNRVLAVDVSTGVSSLFKEGFTSPWSVAFDSAGNMYVSNNKGNSIYRWKKESGTLAPYADVPSPGGLVTDRGGYVYAIDNTANNLYRITPLGDASVFASGISSPTGVFKIGTTLYALSAINNSLVAVDTTTTRLSTLARGFNNPFGLAYDDVRDCFYVSNPGNGTIVRVNRTTGASATVLTGTGTAFGGAYGISYRNGRLYLRSNAQVLSYDVTNFANPTVAYETVVTTNMGIAKDTAAGSPNNGSYFIASSANRILQVVGDTGLNVAGSTSGTNRIVVFKENDGNLDNPRDVAVDGSGKVWVANQFAPGRLTVYNPNGTLFAANITDGISNPLGMTFDGANVWVANYDAMTITAYNAAGSKVGTVSTAPDHPRNPCFYGGKVYLAMGEGIGKIEGGVYARINSELAGYNDIEADAGGIYVLAGGGRKLEWDWVTHKAWYANYQSPSFFWKDGGGEFWMTDSIRFTRYARGYHANRLIGAISWFNGPTLAGVDSNGNVFLNALSACSSEVVNRLKAGPPQQEWSYNVGGITCWVPMTGAFSYDTLGNFYISSYNGLTVQRVDSTGAATTIGNSGVGASHTTYGSWVEPDGSALYQTNQAFHRIERLDITGANGTRTVLPYGLSSAEM